MRAGSVGAAVTSSISRIAPGSRLAGSAKAEEIAEILVHGVLLSQGGGMSLSQLACPR